MRARCSLLFLLLVACGGDDDAPANNCPNDPNKAPVIDSLDPSAEVVASNGHYIVPIPVKFHDDNCDAVTKVRVRIPDGNKFDETTFIEKAVPQATGATITLDFDATTVPPGTYELFVSVFDSRGLESEAQSRKIAFK